LPRSNRLNPPVLSVPAAKEEAKETAKEKLPVGTEFSFSWQVKDDTARLADLKGKDVEILKSHLEGVYRQKK
jgi:hypothetical protein